MNATKLSYADTMNELGLASCDFCWSCEDGINSYSVFAEASEPGSITAITPMFDYNNDEHDEAIKEICMAIVNDAFPDIHNISEVGGSFYPMDGEVIFEGQVITLMTGVTATIS